MGVNTGKLYMAMLIAPGFLTRSRPGPSRSQRAHTATDRGCAKRGSSSEGLWLTPEPSPRARLWSLRVSKEVRH